jgi:hypothetical protein
MSNAIFVIHFQSRPRAGHVEKGEPRGLIEFSRYTNDTITAYRVDATRDRVLTMTGGAVIPTEYADVGIVAEEVFKYLLVDHFFVPGTGGGAGYRFLYRIAAFCRLE